tara:strand:+ start:18728 stop:19195 length:468 start_codon:yes stop_codon:yes gene_type:complete
MYQQVLGFDCSSYAIHMVELDMATHEIVRMDKWADKSKDLEARFNAIVDAFEKNSELDMGDRIAVIENPIYVQSAKATIAITNVIAGTKRALHRMDIEYRAVANTSWKKMVLSNGMASKEEIMNFAKMKWKDIEFKEQDWADAACIALYGAILLK